MATGIRAEEIMSKEVVITRPDMNLVDAAKLMNKFRIGGLPVIEKGKLVGALTERMIMKDVIEADKKPSSVLVKDIMMSPRIIVSRDTDINIIAKKMAEEDVSRVFVCDKDRLVGIITNRDVLKHSHTLIDILIEQARIKGPINPSYTAFGKCELCGTSTHLIFKGKLNKFICDMCTRGEK